MLARLKPNCVRFEGEHSRKLVNLKVRGALSLAGMQDFEESNRRANKGCLLLPQYP